MRKASNIVCTGMKNQGMSSICMYTLAGAGGEITCAEVTITLLQRFEWPSPYAGPLVFR